jgi:hypothetical protein
MTIRNVTEQAVLTFILSRVRNELGSSMSSYAPVDCVPVSNRLLHTSRKEATVRTLLSWPWCHDRHPLTLYSESYHQYSAGTVKEKLLC